MRVSKGTRGGGRRWWPADGKGKNGLSPSLWSVKLPPAFSTGCLVHAQLLIPNPCPETHFGEGGEGRGGGGLQWQEKAQRYSQPEGKAMAKFLLY